jgi:hypothetical protein
MWNLLSGHTLGVNHAEVSVKTTSSEDSRFRGLPPSVYFLFIYSSLFASTNQGKTLVASEVYHVVFTANICMNRMG